MMLPNTQAAVFECQGCGHLIVGHPPDDCEKCGHGHWTSPPQLDKKPASIGLAMILKDEDDKIVSCLESCRDLITHWVIGFNGTGTTTPRLVEETLAGTPGLFYKSEWKGHATNRTELMRRAKGTADYLLLLDADMVLRQKAALPELVEDEYIVRIVLGDLAYYRPLLVRGDRDWVFSLDGVEEHAGLKAVEGVVTRGRFEELWVEDRSVRQPGKIENDLPGLEAAFERDPSNTRTVFYLAQTYWNLGMWDDALKMYRLRAVMGGWDEEVFISHYRCGTILCEQVDIAQGIEELLEAYRLRPHRAEPLRALARACNNVADKLPLPDDILFVQMGDYVLPREAVEPISDEEVREFAERLKSGVRE